MEKPAFDVLSGKVAKFKESNVDPDWLAGELLSAGIIGASDVEKAGNEKEVASKRRGDLVITVMGNGAPDVFQTFVNILLKRRNSKWLGKELKADFTKAGGVWRKKSSSCEPGPTDAYSEERGTKRKISTPSLEATDASPEESTERDALLGAHVMKQRR